MTASLLTPRETEVVQLVGCYRYLGLIHLEEFLFAGSPTTEMSRKVITRRIVQRLRAHGLLGATTRLFGGPGGGSTRLGYHLTANGDRLARSLNPDLPLRHSPRGGTFLMQHALMTADVALAFRRAARTNPGHEVIDWECDWQAAQRLSSVSVVPDAHVVYATADHELDALIEIDLATEGSRFFGAKISRYLELFRSGSWQKRFPTWPVVLTVTPTEARAVSLQHATEAVLAARSDRQRLIAQTEFAFASLPRLVTEGPVATIWRIAGQTGEHSLLPGVIRNE